jgi:hypothetical protein
MGERVDSVEFVEFKPPPAGFRDSLSVAANPLGLCRVHNIIDWDAKLDEHLIPPSTGVPCHFSIAAA